jgi:phospholipase C
VSLLCVVTLGCSSAPDDSCAGPCPQTNIKHVVILVQENHTFDNHFGRYCTAPAGSNPTCNAGPACCEAAPQADPSGAPFVNLDDGTLGVFDPNHSSACETDEIDNGKMDRFAAGASCSDPRNVATSDPAIIKPYWDLAAGGALGDRYFQPIIGASSANDMYMARAAFVFEDNSEAPQGAAGVSCTLGASAQTQYPDQTIGDLLSAASVPWTYYAGGYAAQATAAAQGTCASGPDACTLSFYPCTFDPSDVPFEYYASTRDAPAHIADDQQFLADLNGGSLPAVSWVRAVGYESEHAGQLAKLSVGVAWVTGMIDAVQASRYRDSTLVILTYDEGGGYFDHVTPPPPSAVDGKSYGTRLPFLAVGKFAKKGFVSHVTMEHSSLVKFIEWNFLGGKTGQLGTRDAVVNNIGSVLDPATTGVAVPEN